MLVGPTLDMLEHSLIETPAAATSNKHQLPCGLCLAPSSVLLTKALISHADLSYLFSDATNVSLRAAVKEANLATGVSAWVFWAANKRFEISKFKFKFPRARTFELIRA